MDREVLTLEGVNGQIIDADQVHPEVHQQVCGRLGESDIIGLEARSLPQCRIGCFEEHALGTGQFQRPEVIRCKVCRRIRERTDPGWPHEHVRGNTVDGQTCLEKMAWGVEVCASMGTQDETADICCIAPLQLRYGCDSNCWITRIDGQRWR